MKCYRNIIHCLSAILFVSVYVCASDPKDSDTYSQSSQSSRLSEEARLIGLQRVTDELYATSPTRHTPPQRHHSFDQNYMTDPQPPLRLGDSFASLPDLLEETTRRLQDENIDSSDWLTPRAERQLHELFPNMVSHFSRDTSNLSVESPQRSPRGRVSPSVSSERSYQTPYSHAEQVTSRTNTPMQQQQQQQPSTSRSSSSSQRHIPRRRRHICPHCLLSFDRRDYLNRHVLDHELDEREREVIECPICRAVYMGRTTLTSTHIPTHYYWDPSHQEIRLV